MRPDARRRLARARREHGRVHNIFGVTQMPRVRRPYGNTENVLAAHAGELIVAEKNS